MRTRKDFLAAANAAGISGSDEAKISFGEICYQLGKDDAFSSTTLIRATPIYYKMLEVLSKAQFDTATSDRVYHVLTEIVEGTYDPKGVRNDFRKVV